MGLGKIVNLFGKAVSGKSAAINAAKSVSIMDVASAGSRASGHIDALTAFQNIMGAHGGVSVIHGEWKDFIRDYYDLQQEAVEILGLEGIPWENGIYDKDRDGVDFEEEVELLEEKLVFQICNEWLDGSRWIPYEVLEWAFYEVSDHNR